MVESYKAYVGYLNDPHLKIARDTVIWSKSLPMEMLDKRVLSDLEILLEGLKKAIYIHSRSPFRRCKTLKGCTRDIFVGNCREYVGYIGEEQEMHQEEVESDEKRIEEMREEEIEGLEELQERMRGYGSD